MDELNQTVINDQNQTVVNDQNKKTFKNIYFSGKGRISWREYALYTACLSLLYLAVCFIIWFIYWLSWPSTENLDNFSIIAAVIIWIPYLIMEIMVSIKRVHDFWKKGSYVRCLLIPLYNVYVWLQLLFQKWNEWKNEYWDKPEPFSSGKKALTIILYIIYIIICAAPN